MLSKKNIKKDDGNSKQAKKPKRMWAGQVGYSFLMIQVPTQQSSHDATPSAPTATNENKLIFKGYTGDTAGIIVDTSAGMLKYKKQKIDKKDVEEQQKKSVILTNYSYHSPNYLKLSAHSFIGRKQKLQSKGLSSLNPTICK
jgi:hypothetical protein